TFLEAPPGTDERAIEIPWALARVRPGDRVLDVGTANAEPAYLAALLARASHVVGVDLAQADVPGIRTVVADVRDLPFEDGAFDPHGVRYGPAANAVLCASLAPVSGARRLRRRLRRRRQDARVPRASV